MDAANLPGRLVKIPLDQGTICANTGLLVNFWVNDMTGKGTANLPPNINLFLLGERRMVKRIFCIALLPVMR